MIYLINKAHQGGANLGDKRKKNILKYIYAVNIFEYMASNRLVINPSKTCIMINSKSKKEDIETVKINHHIDILTRSLNQKISIIRRLKEILSPAQLISVGEALVNSKIRYGIAVHSIIRLSSDDPKNRLMQRLQTLQNGMMRLILGKKRSDHVAVESLLKKTGYLSVNRLAAYHTLQEVFSILRCDAVPSLADDFVISKNEFHDTRHNHSQHLKLPSINLIIPF